MNLKLCAALAIFGALPCALYAFEFPQYNIRLLPRYADFDGVVGLNNSGDAVIQSNMGVFYISPAGEQYRIPGVSRAIGLTEAGQVAVGVGTRLGVWSRQSGTTMMESPAHLETDAWSISQSGKIGYTQFGPGGSNFHAAIWDSATNTQQELEGADFPFDVEDSGWAIGRNGSRWFNGALHGYELGNSNFAMLYSINSQGMMVGDVTTSGGPGSIPTVWNSNGEIVFQADRDPEWPFSSFGGINDAGAVAGWDRRGSLSRAVVWHQDTGLIDFNTLIAPGSLDLQIETVSDITQNGTMVGTTYVDGVFRHVILTPVPEPGTMLALGAGLAALLRRRRDR